jgi:hypothetical protein
MSIILSKYWNYNEISYYFIFNFDFQYKPKVIIMLNSMLPLVRIMNTMKINQYKFY